MRKIFQIYFVLQLWSTSVRSEDPAHENDMENSMTFDWKDQGEHDEFFYDFRKLQNSPSQVALEDIPEMTHKVKVVNVQGKYRGLIAAQYIRAGGLVLASRAVALTQAGSKPDEYDAFHDLVAETTRILTERSELRPIVYNLWAGDELKFLDHDENTEGWTIDEDRIRGVCNKNNFIVHGAHKTVAGLTVNGRGLWYLPSFANHDCLGNAIWFIRGDFMFFRAVKPIKSGEEILVSYNDPKKLWWKREDKSLEHDIHCQCRLCELDRSESQEWHSRREQVFGKFEEERLQMPFDQLMDMSLKLESMREPHPADLNIAIFPVVFDIATLSRNQENWPVSFLYYEKAFNIVYGSTSTLESPYVSLFALDASLRAGDEEQQMIWLDRFKKAASLMYGDLHMVSWYIEDFMQVLPFSNVREFVDQHEDELQGKTPGESEMKTSGESESKGCDATNNCPA